MTLALPTTVDDAKVQQCLDRLAMQFPITAEVIGGQPLDADLTAIAALATTAYGRGLLTLANAAAARTSLELGTAATKAVGDFDAAGAAAAAQAASQPLDSDLTAIAALATTEFGRSLLTAASATKAREAIEAASSAALTAVEAKLPTTAVLTEKVGPIKEQTELQNITGLSFEIGASATEIWHVHSLILVEAGNVTMDVKIGWSALPAGASGYWGGETGGSTAGLAGFGAVLSTATPTTLNWVESRPYATNSGVVGVLIRAVIYGGGTGGTVQMKYAQNTKNAENLSILKGSVLQAWKLAS